MTRIFVFLLALCSIATAQDKFVTISERQIPVAYDVDVLVVGGSVGNVAAAIESQKAGAKTMLITERSYLGDDMTATLQLWPEKNEEFDDLVGEIFNDQNRGKPTEPVFTLLGAGKKIPFSYSIEQQIDKKHPETDRKNRLTDGSANDPVHGSLQINSDATIILDLKKSQTVGVVGLYGFHREGEEGYKFDAMTVSASDDETNWKELGSAKPMQGIARGNETPDLIQFALVTPVNARYLKLHVKKAAKSSRILLGEIVVLADINLIPERITTKIDGIPTPRPMHVKTALDQELLKNGVEFLYGTYAIGMLRDNDGTVRGVIINNRGGKQAIVAKNVIISQIGPYAQSSDSNDEKYYAEYVVIGGEPKSVLPEKYSLLKSATHEIVGEPFYGSWPNRAGTKSGEFPLIRYRFEIDKKTYDDKSLQGINTLENQIRLVTFDPDQQFTADQIVLTTSSSIRLSVTDRIDAGQKLGKRAADAAKRVAPVAPDQLSVAMGGTVQGESVGGDVKESLSNIRPFQNPLGFVKETDDKIPVIAEYDVVVVGGGTTGAPAGIAAARQGAKTLVLEYLHDLGGVGTAGAISVYWFGNRVGFCQEVEGGKAAWNIEQRIFWWRSKLLEAGADVWYGVLGTGAVVEGNVLKGIQIATPNGPRIILAKAIIDATGNADIAQIAGVEMQPLVDDKEIAVQGAGLPPRNLGASYTNTDYMYVDENDPVDATHVLVYGKEKFPKAFDFAKILDTRERRRIVGEFVLTALDQVNKRTYPDTICRTRSNFDTHGYTTNPFFELEHLHHAPHFCDMPYRCCLPKNIDGLLVGGLATSCERDAVPIIRMQPDLQNQGYALGCIAAKAAKDGVALRKVDLKPVQKHLVEIGNLEESVLTDTDNYETLISQLPAAVKTIPDEYKGTAMLLWHPKEAAPLLREAYEKTDDKKVKLPCAMVLAAMGDATGAETILAEIQSFDKWDKGWNFMAMGQFGWASSVLDRYIMMLGRTKDKRGAAVIAEKVKLLEAKDDFSHHRACALALEWIGDKSAAPAIAEVLKKPGVAGYAHLDLETARKWDKADPKGGTAEKSRRDSLIEIGYARALYRLGDVDGLGKKILEEYSKDLRGYFSRHANEILKK